jgi:very-short-patch-repair endonuclease
LLTAREVFKNSGSKFFFDCYICNHEFNIELEHLNTENVWCSYCSNPPKILCKDEKCETCFEKSFAGHPKSIYWSDKNLLKPRDVFRAVADSYIFNCINCGNEYTTRLDTISRGSWCSCTMNKTETKLEKWLTENYNLNIEKQKKFEWCKNDRPLPFDFCIEGYKIIVELDRRQHFVQVKYWNSPEEQQEWDKYKMDCANQNGYSVIRLLQDDVWYNKNNWDIKLREAIKKYDKPTNIMIGDIYNDFSAYN